jgi:hypothetical protein
VLWLYVVGGTPPVEVIRPTEVYDTRAACEFAAERRRASRMDGVSYRCYPDTVDPRPYDPEEGAMIEREARLRGRPLPFHVWHDQLVAAGGTPSPEFAAAAERSRREWEAVRDSVPTMEAGQVDHELPALAWRRADVDRDPGGRPSETTRAAPRLVR